MTPFTVHLVRGSGRVDAGTVAPGSSLSVINTFGSAEDYYPLFDIPMTDAWSIERLRPDDRNFYFRIDNTLARQEIDITVPANLSETGVYVVFENNSRSGGVSITRNNSIDRLTGINFPAGKDNINVGEAIVIRDNNPQEISNYRVTPNNINFGQIRYQPGYVYSFSFDGTRVTQTDARPLNEIGAPALAGVEFAGAELNNAEQQEIISALNAAMGNSHVPLRLILPQDESNYQERIFYKLRINIPIQIMPPAPPANMSIMRISVSLALVQGSNVIRSADLGNFSDIVRANVIRQGAALIRDASAFYQGIISDLSR